MTAKAQVPAGDIHVADTGTVTPCRDRVDGPPQRADARRNTQRLLDAARASFAERGSSASLEEIARRAEVGIGTLYRHFPTRLDLVEAVYRDDVESLLTLAEDESVEPWGAVVAWFERFVETASTKRELFAELAEALGKDAATFSHCRDTLRTAASMVIERAQRAGVVRADVEPFDAVRLVGGFVHGPKPDKDQVRRMLDLVLAGLRAP
ncbi:MAG: TetR/AcrR family transcriptional regulator [Mycobacteriales bacterium]